MIQNYNFSKIQNLLMDEAFTVNNIRFFCYDYHNFIKLYEKLPANLEKTDMVNEILSYTKQNNLFDILLKWAKKFSPKIYEKHQPYQKIEGDIVMNLIIEAIRLYHDNGQHNENLARAYQKFKQILADHFGPKGDLFRMVELFETNPNKWQSNLEEEIKSSKINQKRDIIEAAQAVLDVLKEPSKQPLTQGTQITGDNNINIHAPVSGHIILGNSNQIIIGNNAPKPTIEELLIQARQALENYDYPLVLNKCQSIMEANPHHGEANLLKAVALLEGKNAGICSPSKINGVVTHLKNAQKDIFLATTTLTILGLIKYDYFIQNRIRDNDHLKFDEIKQKLHEIAFVDLNTKWLDYITYSSRAKEKLGLS